MIRKNETYKIFLKNERIYTGRIKDENDDFITIIDKYGEERVINKDTISDMRKL